MKYVDEFKSIVRGKTLSMEKKFYPIDENMENTSPEEYYAPFSRFLVTILDNHAGKKVPVKANIKIDEMASITARTNYAVKKILDLECEGIQPSTSEAGSLAYTEIIKFGDNKGKTPAEVLVKDPTQKKNLEGIKKILEENVVKYPANQKLIDAIDDAIKLLDSGELAEDHKIDKASTKNIMILKPIEKYFTSQADKDEDGNHKIYKISIYCDPSKDYPFTISIMNYHAPVIPMQNGLTQIQKSSAKNKISFSMNLLESEWLDFVRFMNAKMRDFELTHKDNIHEQNESLRWKIKSQA